MRTVRDKSRRGLPLRADINVTSLVDVAFTLLVIFIITAPIMQGGVEVAVPSADIAPLTADQEPVIVSIEADGSTYIGDQEVTGADFETLLARVVEARRATTVFVRGDSLAAYGLVARAIAGVQGIGDVSISLVLEQRRRER